MAKFEINLKQELIDHGLDNIRLGRNILQIGDLTDTSPNKYIDGYSQVFDYIEEHDPPYLDSPELEEALTSEDQKTYAIISALGSCSTRSAINAILESGSSKQRGYLSEVLKKYSNFITDGVAYESYDDNYEPIELRKSVSPEDIITGLWRDVVFASMIDTPEMKALSQARRWLRPDDDNKKTSKNIGNLPKTRGYYSYIFPPKKLPQKNSDMAPDKPRHKPGTVGNAFPELAKTYEQLREREKRKHPDDTDDVIEHTATLELARIIAKSTEYNDPDRSESSPYRSGFAEQLAWARLGEGAQRKTRELRRTVMGVDLHNIGRFIGKSRDSPYEREWRKIEKIANRVSPENVDPAREYLLEKARNEIRRQHRQQGNSSASEIIAEGAERITEINNLADDDILYRFQKMKEAISNKRNDHLSLAQKAVDLHIMSRAITYDSPVDWINTAPFGLINRTFKAIKQGVSIDTAFAYAVAEQTFTGETITHDHIDACRGATKSSLKKIKIINAHCKTNKISMGLDDRLQLSMVSKMDDASDIIDLVKQGYSAEDILDNQWLCYLSQREPIDFPARGSDPQKYRWCAENGYAYLSGGWTKTAIGKLILTRLDSGIEESIHSASQWLETFQMPEEGYDVPAIKAHIQNGEAVDPNDLEKVKFYDINLETGLLTGVLKAPQELRDRLLIPRKKQKIQQILFSPEHQLLYLALADVYRDHDLSVDKVRNIALDKLDEFYDGWLVNAHGKETTHRISKDDLKEKMSMALTQIDESTPQENESITGIIQQLSKYGNNRKGYIDDATSWLLRHTTSPNARLTRVWGDRPTALAEGVNDSARDIDIWRNNNALIKKLTALEGQGKIPRNLTVAEIAGELNGWLNELLRCYDSDTTIQAISHYISIRTSEALLPAQIVEIQTLSGVYKAEILAKDDPRGMTIGVDTGCCMTLHGASCSCIESGYRDKNAGFFALYTPKGGLAAQSYFYVNTDHPNILVLDNIEANQGRDTNKIVEIYKQALSKYLLERFATDRTWNIDTVNLGTGYGDAVKSSVLRLPATNPIHNNLGDHIYSDASDQRLLLHLSQHEIAESRKQWTPAKENLENTPNHLPNIVTRSITPNDFAIIKELEEQIYPEHIRQYDDKEMLQDELKMNSMETYSFLVAGQADSSKDYIGYCMAYLDQSETEPGRHDPVVYAADMAILPEAQGFHIGAKMFDELLKRTSERGVDKIEMHARETTSYPALKNSEWAKHILYRRGYKFVDHGVVDEFDDGNGNIENLYLVSIEKI